MNLVTRIEFGSHLYGTSTPDSDHDWKSVYLPEARDILLQRVQASTGHTVKRSEGLRNTAQDTDDEAYSLQRYLQLLSEGQTVALDMLFAPAPTVTTPLWELIRANKHRLLTKRSAAFVGYCRAQANKYGIKGSRVAAARKAVDFFALAIQESGELTRVEFWKDGLYSLTDEHTRIVTIETTLGHEETFFECCNRKISFGNTIKAAYEIFYKIYANYGERARKAEEGQGVDWKALSHAVRVGWEARELLVTGKITFPIPNAKWLVEIKQGRVPYDDVAAQIEFLLEEVERAVSISTLPEEADGMWIDDLVAGAYADVIMKAHHAVIWMQMPMKVVR